jgi:hypothetical protein
MNQKPHAPNGSFLKQCLARPFLVSSASARGRLSTPRARVLPRPRAPTPLPIREKVRKHFLRYGRDRAQP